MWVLTFKAVADLQAVGQLCEKVTHITGEEVEANHHDDNHNGHEVLRWHYGCSGNT